jgi:hypothetical protein
MYHPQGFVVSILYDFAVSFMRAAFIGYFHCKLMFLCYISMLGVLWFAVVG